MSRPPPWLRVAQHHPILAMAGTLLLTGLGLMGTVSLSTWAVALVLALILGSI